MAQDGISFLNYRIAEGAIHPHCFLQFTLSEFNPLAHFCGTTSNNKRHD